LARLAACDNRIWVLDGDLGDSNGAALFAARWPERFVAAGIAEQSMVSMAAGMASCGARPWVFSFAAFLSCRAYDQVRVSVSQALQPVTLVGSHAGGCSGHNGKTHASLNDVALMASLPQMSVWAPAGPGDVRHAVNEILREGRPAYLRLPRLPLNDLAGEPGTWRRLTGRGTTVLLGAGFGSHLALATATLLRDRRIETAVIHCQRIAPLPPSLVQTLADAERVFVVDDHSTFGGLASLLQRLGLGPKIYALGWPPDWPAESGSDEALLAAHGLDPPGLAEAVIEAM
jgi:transketolase